MDRVYGIDLGTTNSLIGYLDDDGPRIVCDSDGGSPLLPSVVSFLDAQHRVVGAAARRRAAAHPLETLASVKRFMGLGYEHVAPEDRLHYAFAPEGNVVRFRIHGRDWTPVEVSALILEALKERVRKATGEEVRRVVITVPAYFNDSQRQATRDAGRLAGLEVLRLLNEPTAASLAYGLERRGEGVVAVYDFGGGTFDLSLLKLRQGIFEVLATSGDTRLGGDDLDRRLAGLLLESVPPALRDHPEVRRRALEEAERSKIRLTEQAETVMELSLPEHGVALRRPLARAELEALVNDIVERTLEPCRRALDDAGLRPEQVDEVVLVGGSTRVPLVRRRVAELFGRTPHTELDPDQVVAIGAAVQAGVLSGRRKDTLLLDVVPLSLGIESMGGVFERVIDRNTTIPAISRQIFTTFVDNQTAVDFHVLQGERELAADNRSLARFQLRGLHPQPAGTPRIEVTFLVDASGILNVTARDLKSGREQSVDVKPSYGLTDEEVERMLESSFDHAEEDVAARLLIEARNEADVILRVTRKALEQATAEERAAIQPALRDLEGRLADTDHNRIRDAVEALNRASLGLAQRLMDSTIAAALRDRRADDL